QTFTFAGSPCQQFLISSGRSPGLFHIISRPRPNLFKHAMRCSSILTGDSKAAKHTTVAFSLSILFYQRQVAVAYLLIGEGGIFKKLAALIVPDSAGYARIHDVSQWCRQIFANMIREGFHIAHLSAPPWQQRRRHFPVHALIARV